MNALDKTYSPYIIKPSEIALQLWESTKEQYSQSIHTQVKRTPAFMEFVLRMHDANLMLDAQALDNVYLAHSHLPYFIQWDQRWALEPYAAETIAEAGCGPTCLAMVHHGLYKQEASNPLSMAKWASEEGYAADNNGSFWALMDEGAEKLEMRVDVLANTEAEVIAALTEKKVLITILGPGHFTSSGHFIVLDGINAQNEIRILDPFSYENSLRTWTYQELEQQMRKIWAYRQ